MEKYMAGSIVSLVVSVIALVGLSVVGVLAMISRQHTSKTGLRRRNPYRCVSIHTGTNCCSAVTPYLGRRWLSHEAPWLPLHECSQASCQCRYVHHADRRQRPRRAVDKGLSLASYAGIERRASFDRRDNGGDAAW